MCPWTQRSRQRKLPSPTPWLPFISKAANGLYSDYVSVVVAATSAVLGSKSIGLLGVGVACLGVTARHIKRAA